MTLPPLRLCGICEWCGALVSSLMDDLVTHTRFHESLMTTADKAGAAYLYSRRIG